MQKPGNSFFSKEKWINFLIHPFFLALILASTIIIIFTNPVEEYQIKFTNTQTFSDETYRIYYHDLNNDNNSEGIQLFRNKVGGLAIKIYNTNQVSLNQYNFPEFPYSRHHDISFADSDEDGYSEVYFLTFNTDSVYLNCIEPFQEGIRFSRKFVDTVYRKLEKPDIGYNGVFLTDIDEDNENELTFYVRGGFALYPRRFYSYDFREDTFYKGPVCGALLNGLYLKDIDGDSYEEYLLGTSAYNNFPDTIAIPYHDSSAWFIVMDHNLEFLFEPVKVPGVGSYTRIFPVVTKQKNLLAYKRKIEGDTYKYEIVELDLTGNVKNSLPIRTKGPQLSFHYVPEMQKVFIGDGERYFIIDESFKLQEMHLKGVEGAKLIDCYDLDGDGENELIMENTINEELLVVSDDHDDVHSLKIPRLNARVSSGPVNQNGSMYYHIQTLGVNYIFNYRENPYAWLQIPYYLVIYLGALLFVWVIIKIQKRQLKERYALERKVEQLKLLSVRNQLDPHFMFNTINTIASSIFNEDKHRAYRQLIRFSQMMRSTVEHHDKTNRSLRDELKFIQNYLEIQQQRFTGQFEYTIETDPGVDSYISVPTMSVQTYVENAIKHGIKPLKDRKGELKISVKDLSKHVKITVQDNGIGRIKSNEYNKNTTKLGLRSLREMYHVLNQLNKYKIREHFTDLYDKDGHAIGTRVELIVPKEMEYELYQGS